MAGVRAAFDETMPGHRLAYVKDGASDELTRCGFFWLGGFRSDMMGSKAEALSSLAHRTRRNCLRFDYSGHGQSGGQFTEGTISKWLDQSAHMFRSHAAGNRIVVGSSMGGWLALLLARKLQAEDGAAFRRIKGLVLIAPAIDMTRKLMWDTFPEPLQRQLAGEGRIEIPSGYGDPYPITKALIGDGERHLLLGSTLPLPFPVRVIQGVDDPDVPLDHAMLAFDVCECSDITATLVKGGDHRLSKPQELKVIEDVVIRLAEHADGLG